MSSEKIRGYLDSHAYRFIRERLALLYVSANFEEASFLGRVEILLNYL